MQQLVCHARHRLPPLVGQPWQGALRALASQTEPLQEGITDAANGGLTAEQTEMQRMAQHFAREELLPHASKWDECHTFPVDTLRQAAQLGFAGLYVPEQYGGADLSRLDGSIIFEALSFGDVASTAYLTIHNMVAHVINRFGSDALKQAYLPRLTTMELLASYCLTEPGSGSDAASLKTTATRVEGGWQLSGSKAFISGAGASDVYLVMARQAGAASEGGGGISAFVVDKGSPGLSFGAPERKMGWRCQPTAAVTLDSVFVPESNMLGAPGQGFKVAMSALDGGRINIAACSLGGAAFCLDYAWRYTSERRQFGRPIGDMQVTQFKLADMATGLQASRLMVWHAARSLDGRSPTATLDAAMAKRFATDTCFGVADSALQLLGGYGYLSDYPVERCLRDLRVHSILEGTNEIMRVIIHRQMQRLQHS